MKYRVKVEEQWYEVEIKDLTTQPVIAYVDGESFEVWPESSDNSSIQTVKQPASSATPSSPKPAKPTTTTTNHPSLKAVLAPIPGVIISIAVQPHTQVIVGQELCVLEAMKMRNSIRATRNGEILQVKVTPGQHVGHHDVLMEFAD